MSATPDLVTVTGDGVSVQLPSYFASVPEATDEAVRLVAAVTPWDAPESFRPTLTVAVEPASPERASIEQHAALTIAEQIELGAHVAATDLWPVEGQPEGRRVVSIHAAMNTTVVQVQYLAVRGDRVVTMSLQQDAAVYAASAPVFALATGTLQVEHGDAVRPDPAAAPNLDAFAAARGLSLEDLSRVRAAQPFVADGVRLGPGQLAGLLEGNMAKVEHPLIHQASRTVIVEATTGQSRATLHAYLSPAGAAVVATAPPGAPELDPDEGTFTLAEYPAAAAAVAVARWIGVAPAWPFGLSDDGPATIPLELFNSRVGDSNTPMPEGAAPALVRLWSQPWQLTTLTLAGADESFLLLITDAAGAVHVVLDEEAGTATLTPLLGDALLRTVLRLCGFDEA